MPSSINSSDFPSCRRARCLTASVSLVMIALCVGNCSAIEYPEWVVGPIGLSGAWESAPAMVIADLRTVKLVGVQQLSGPPPWPASPSIRRIYWCEGDFTASLAIRGRLPKAGRKFLWGQIREGCDVFHPWEIPESEPAIRVWFIREEGEYVRPIADAGGVFFSAFRERWEGARELDPQTRFAQLLLTAGRSGRDLPEYVVHGILNTACYILGRHSVEPEPGERCTQELDILMRLDPLLRPAICDYRRAAFGEDCVSPGRKRQ